MWRKGKTLVFYRHANFPDTCIRCGEAAAGYRMKKKVDWVRPEARLFLGLIALLWMRKTAILEVGLCQKHKRRRKMQMIFAAVLGVLGVVTMIVMNQIYGPGSDSDTLPSFLMLAAIILAFRLNLWTVKRMDKEKIWLNGLGGPFLAQFEDQDQ